MGIVLLSGCNNGGSTSETTKQKEINMEKENEREMLEMLCLIDMQNDFITGALGSAEAQAIVQNVVEKVESSKGRIFVTQDTHGDNYMETREGKFLPVPHCIYGEKGATFGWKLNKDVQAALDAKQVQGAIVKYISKPTFGSSKLVNEIADVLVSDEFKDIEDKDIKITFVGLCTDICVVSNALLVKAYFPEINIACDAKCCAGVTPAKHEAALETMRSCQIEVY